MGPARRIFTERQFDSGRQQAKLSRKMRMAGIYNWSD